MSPVSSYVVLLIACGSLSAAAQPPHPPAVPDSAARERVLLAAVADVVAGRKPTPLVTETIDEGTITVTFLARRVGGPIPRIVSDVTGWGERPDNTFDFKAGTMARVGTTEWYWLQAAVARGARIEYLVAHGLRDFRLDPYNPRRTQLRGGSPASEFVTPGYVPTPAFEEPAVRPAGRVTEATVESRALGRSVPAVVYTPPGYREDGHYPLAVFHAALHVAHAGEAPRVLDWLIAHGAMDPIVAVFVDPGPEESDQGTPLRLRTFLAEELLAWMAQRYRVTGSSAERAIVAISYGAKDALDAAVMSAAFGRLGLVIPGRRLTAADIEAYAARPGPRLRVTILAGLYDAPNLATARGTRAALGAAGHTLDYIEVPEGHNQATWRNHLGDVLVSLFPGRATTPPVGANGQKDPTWWPPRP